MAYSQTIYVPMHTPLVKSRDSRRAAVLMVALYLKSQVWGIAAMELRDERERWGAREEDWLGSVRSPCVSLGAP